MSTYPSQPYLETCKARLERAILLAVKEGSTLHRRHLIEAGYSNEKLNRGARHEI